VRKITPLVPKDDAQATSSYDERLEIVDGTYGYRLGKIDTPRYKVGVVVRGFAAELYLSDAKPMYTFDSAQSLPISAVLSREDKSMRFRPKGGTPTEQAMKADLVAPDHPHLCLRHLPWQKKMSRSTVQRGLYW
jgi:hypothetical protein